MLFSNEEKLKEVTRTFPRKKKRKKKEDFQPLLPSKPELPTQCLINSN
jgi:hypothetical protein